MSKSSFFNEDLLMLLVPRIVPEKMAIETFRIYNTINAVPIEDTADGTIKYVSYADFISESNQRLIKNACLQSHITYRDIAIESQGMTHFMSFGYIDNLAVGTRARWGSDTLFSIIIKESPKQTRSGLLVKDLDLIHNEGSVLHARNVWFAYSRCTDCIKFGDLLMLQFIFGSNSVRDIQRRHIRFLRVFLDTGLHIRYIWTNIESCSNKLPCPDNLKARINMEFSPFWAEVGINKI